VTDDDFTTPTMKMATGPVTIQHHKWLDMAEHDYSPKALRFLRKALGGGYRRARPGRISVSSLGYCERKQIFQFWDAPQTPPPDIKGRTLMDMGTWGHLRWQAEGLTMGWLQRAELWVQTRKARGARTNMSGAPDRAMVAGSMDGILDPDHGFELKTTNYRTFDKIRNSGEVPHAHALQVNAYMMLTDIERFSMVYETREWGDFHEIVLEGDPAVQDEVRDIVRGLREHVDHRTLPPILEECQWKQGYTYSGCPWRAICLKVGSARDIPGVD
jgi:hypothetical protein